MNLAQISSLQTQVALSYSNPGRQAPWKSRTHLCSHGFSRRQFLRATSAVPGFILAHSVWSRAANNNCNPSPLPHVTDLPDPLPDIHIQLPGVPGFQPMDTDPSTIGDFNGHLGYAVIDGTGIRTDLATGDQTVNAFEVDLRFMKGEFVSLEGRHCHGTFALI